MEHEAVTIFGQNLAPLGSREATLTQRRIAAYPMRLPAHSAPQYAHEVFIPRDQAAYANRYITITQMFGL